MKYDWFINFQNLHPLNLSLPELKKTIGGTENNLVGIIYITKSIVIVYLYYDR